MPILFVTGNVHKFNEVSAILGDYGIVLEHAEYQFRELESDSLNAIAADKARQAFSAFRAPLIVEDTGFFLDALRGFPSTHAKWVFSHIGFRGLFALLEGKKRTGHFQTVLCYIDHDTIKTFSATMKGRCTKTVLKPRARTMPYNKIFIPRGKDKTLVELPESERRDVLQRGKVARAFGDWYNKKAEDDLLDNIE